jgi:hypothetical protein
MLLRQGRGVSCRQLLREGWGRARALVKEEREKVNRGSWVHKQGSQGSSYRGVLALLLQSPRQHTSMRLQTLRQLQL